MTSQDRTKGTVTISVERRDYGFPIDSLSKVDQVYLDDQATEQKERDAALAKTRSVFQSHEQPKAEIGTWHSCLPDGYDPEGPPHPVCLLVSPGGESLSIMQRMRAAADELDWVLIGVDAYGNDRIDMGKGVPATIKDCQLVHDEAFKTFNINPEKKVFGGMSGGGWWSFCSSHELGSKTAGVISFGGWMNMEHEMPYPRKMAVVLVNGDSDRNANLYAAADREVMEKKHKAEVRIVTFEGGHVLAPENVATEAARWVHEKKGF